MAHLTRRIRDDVANQVMGATVTGAVSNVTDWRGDREDWDRLLAAVARNCECKGSVTCAAHSILTSQKTLDRMAFAMKMRARYVLDEFNMDNPA